ncbi:G_PROTEIN_RECEP_F1_2 domain-containing protein [Caenorhabditis elegans]|uniref:G_PROTEIN_RECEP_F1_2 domain-containing protein n=1 Tax=Caenorhabditis elegans TaxID=6239 RepID=Q8ITZ6_CAEEL|nr:G_PROTEIN_RECEP_F1_2 domain-containing protein [Caenorhabditis elegans]CCD66860.2 G_PROTEIN_RECEP_F1_2 domain-containing protein [Caenorhabditis elegans]|eukprot:NP_503863.2 Serpentine Receptor, class AB (class A-like) [Caenorhabditis elegans]
MSPYTELCQTMEKLSTSSFLQFTLLLNLIAGAIAFVLTIAASYALWKSRVTKLFHINVIIIFQVHLAGFFIHCFNRIILHASDLYRYTLLDYCDMPSSTTRCFAFRIQYVYGLWLVGATTVPLVIERYIATIKSSSYEHIGYRLGIYLALLQVTIAFICTFIAFHEFSFDEPTMSYCIGVKFGEFNNAEIVSLVNLVVQIIARICFQFLFKQNEKLRSEQLTSTLSTRYSLEQNLKSIEILKCFANLQCAFMIVHMVLFVYILQSDADFEQSTYIALVELNSPHPFYAIVSILAFFRTVHSSEVKLKKNLQNHVNADQNVYFENFNKILQ